MSGSNRGRAPLSLSVKVHHQIGLRSLRLEPCRREFASETTASLQFGVELVNSSLVRWTVAGSKIEGPVRSKTTPAFA